MTDDQEDEEDKPTEEGNILNWTLGRYFLSLLA